jgi:hypothetical protein
MHPCCTVYTVQKNLSNTSSPDLRHNDYMLHIKHTLTLKLARKDDIMNWREGKLRYKITLSFDFLTLLFFLLFSSFNLT